MICIQCGAQNEDSISYCRQCGTNLQAVRSALLGVPPAQTALAPAVSSKLAPLVLVLSTLFGFLSFGALFGVIVAIVAIGADPGSRLDPGSTMFLAAVVAITGTIGLVAVLRMLLRMITATTAAPAASAPHAQSHALPQAPHAAALPPPRQPLSVVEHTTANLPNYVRPGRNTGE